MPPDRILWRGWAVVTRTRRGAEWSHPTHVHDTKRRAIAAYEATWGTAALSGIYKRYATQGRVRCVRVTLREE